MRNGEHDDIWLAFRGHFEVGQLIEGVVLEHQPFGFFVDIGNVHFPGLVDLPPRNIEWPAVGTRVKAVFLGFANPDGHQARLSIRPSRVREAERQTPHIHENPEVTTIVEIIWQTDYLPVEQRGMFLRQALEHHSIEVAAAAVWQTQHLPVGERTTFLRHALSFRNPEIAVRAVWQDERLPLEDRMAFFQQALHHGNSLAAIAAIQRVEHLSSEQRLLILQQAFEQQSVEVVAAAVRQVKSLPEGQRAAFLQQASQYRHPTIAKEVVWRVKYFPAEARSVILQRALHDNSEVAIAAINQANDLPTEQRVAFLRQASQHQDHGVVARATWQIEHLLGDTSQS